MMINLEPRSIPKFTALTGEGKIMSDGMKWQHMFQILLHIGIARMINPIDVVYGRN